MLPDALRESKSFPGNRVDGKICQQFTFVNFVANLWRNFTYACCPVFFKVEICFLSHLAKSSIKEKLKRMSERKKYIHASSLIGYEIHRKTSPLDSKRHLYSHLKRRLMMLCTL